MIDIKDVRGLDVHRYAPEMNELVTRDFKRYKCPRIFEVQAALDYVNNKLSKKNGKR